MHLPSRTSSAAHSIIHIHINVFVVFLFVQELFIDKIHIFMYFSMSDKLLLDQLKFITATSAILVVQIPTRKEKYPVLRTNMKPQQLTKHTKIFYFLASHVFHKFLYYTCRNGLNWGTSKLKHFKYLKKYELRYFDTFRWKSAFLVYSCTWCGTSKIICVWKIKCD